MLFGDLCYCCWTGSRNFTSPRALKSFEHRVQTVWALPTAAQGCLHPFLALPVLSSMASSLVGAHGAGRVPRAGTGSRVAAPHSERCSWVQGPSAGCPSLGWDEGSGPWAGTGVGGLWVRAGWALAQGWVGSGEPCLAPGTCWGQQSHQSHALC